MSNLSDQQLQIQIALAEKAGAKWCLVRDFGSEVIRLLLPNDMSQIEPEDITTLNKCPFDLVIDWMHLKEIPPITDRNFLFDDVFPKMSRVEQRQFIHGLSLMLIHEHNIGNCPLEFSSSFKELSYIYWLMLTDPILIANAMAEAILKTKGV
ncbi:hypothetical protein LCGC14_1618170 [marine sediment metagenome]|uniref:Uncharacterized protein n=1 Tax=marine sediment metagenome TaxID=412755 RepID=A0A0F9L695_9ZZZZ